NSTIRTIHASICAFAATGRTPSEHGSEHGDACSMCIILFAWQQHTDYPLVVAANRDEFHHRPAEAVRWRGDLLCGLDLAAGGTWLGMTRAGRFAAVTNFREPIQDRTPGNRSRGMLPLGFLESDDSPQRWLQQLQPEQEQYG